MMPILDHTPYIEKQIIEHVVASHAINIVPKANCKFVKPQNGPTIHEHVIQSLRAILGMVLHVLAHLSTFVIRNYLPIRTISPCGQPNLAPWVLVPLKLHMFVDMP